MKASVAIQVLPAMENDEELVRVVDEVIDYIVVHELCHRKEMNHSTRFYAEVERVFPEYKRCQKWLKENGTNIMKGRRN